MFKLLTFWGLAMLAGLALGPMISSWKNRDSSFWGFLSFVFPPAMLVLLVLPRLSGPRHRRLSWDEADQRDHERHNPPN